MEKRTVIAIVLTILILFLWQFYLSPKKPDTVPQTGPQAGSEGSAGQATPAVPAQTPAKGQGAPGQQVPTQATPAAAATAPTTVLKSTKQITVDTPKFKVTFGDLGGAITSVRLKEHKETIESSEGKEILQNISPYQYFPVISQLTAGTTSTDATIFTPDRDGFSVADKPEKLTFTGTLTNGTKVTKVYTFKPDSYTVDFSVETEAKDNSPVFADFAAMSLKGKSRYVFTGPFVYNGKKLEQIEKTVS